MHRRNFFKESGIEFRCEIVYNFLWMQIIYICIASESSTNTKTIGNLLFSNSRLHNIRVKSKNIIQLNSLNKNHRRHVISDDLLLDTSTILMCMCSSKHIVLLIVICTRNAT